MLVTFDYYLNQRDKHIHLFFFKKKKKESHVTLHYEQILFYLVFELHSVFYHDRVFLPVQIDFEC